MPWSEYKELVRARLNEAVGWHELKTMCETARRDLQSPVAWMQTISRGREILIKLKVNLPDRAYIKKALQYMLPGELDILEKGFQREKLQDDPSYTVEQAQTDLRNTTWTGLVTLVTAVLANSTRKYRCLRSRPAKTKRREKNNRTRGKEREPRKRERTEHKERG